MSLSAGAQMVSFVLFGSVERTSLRNPDRGRARARTTTRPALAAIVWPLLKKCPLADLAMTENVAGRFDEGPQYQRLILLG